MKADSTEIRNSKFEVARWESRILNFEFLIPFALALASFLLYLRTLAPDVVDADGGEFQFAAWNFSFVHPTGYPLYLILGGVFQHLLPIGNPAYRLNVFTAITATLAVAAVYLAAKEITRPRAAAVAAASFALARVFWYDGSAAETYDLNAFFVALLIFIALRWQANPGARTLGAFCFVAGLALTHHRTIILWIPAFVVFFLVAVRRLRNMRYETRPFGGVYTERGRSAQGKDAWRVLRSAALFLLPLALYLYIPLRAPASPYATLPLAPGREIVLYDNSLPGFINYFLGRVFQAELRWDAVSAARMVALPQLLMEQFTAIGVALGGVGIVAMLLRKEWAQFALLATGFAATVLFASLYHIGDIFHYYIPAYLAWAVWVGAGIGGLGSLIRKSKIENRNSRHPFRILNLEFGVGILLALLLLIPQFVINLPLADRSQETQLRAQWTRILSARIPQNAILISNDRDEMMPMWYMQYVENARRDLFGLFPVITPAPQYANIARLTDAVLDAGRPVFFIKPMPGIEIKYRLAAAEPLVSVVGRTVDVPPQFASNAALADRVRVIGYDLTREPNALRVAIYWQPRVKLERNYTTFVHLLDASGSKIAQGNDHQVGGEFYPTSMWDAGETLRDEQAITLPQNVVPGTYRLLIGMYFAPDMERLGEPVEIGTVQLK